MVTTKCGTMWALYLPGAPGGGKESVPYKVPGRLKASHIFTPPHSGSCFSTFLQRVIQYGGQLAMLALRVGISTAALCFS